MDLLNNNYVQAATGEKILSCLDTWLEAPGVRTYVFEHPDPDYRAGQYAMFAFSEVRGRASLFVLWAARLGSTPWCCGLGIRVKV